MLATPNLLALPLTKQENVFQVGGKFLPEGKKSSLHIHPHLPKSQLQSISTMVRRPVVVCG